MQDKKIILGLTTTTHSDWIDKVRELEVFEIKEVALFLTGIDKEQRKELYSLLEKSPLESAPHVHLRHDIDRGEIEYLINKYKTSLFNIHPKGKSKYNYNYDQWSSFKDKIYIENTCVVPTQTELDSYAGVCADFSHWEYFGGKSKQYKNDLELIVAKNKIGCCHVSAIRSFWGIFSMSAHYAKSEKDLDYLKKYKQYLPEIISLELENSFEEQLKFKKYLENILNN